MQTIADKMLEAFEAALSSTLGPGMHATYDSLVAPAVSATFPDFAAGYAAQFMPPVQAQYYTICMSLARASAYVATSLLLYIIGLALWVGAYYDKRNIRALLMVCGCLVAIADTAYTMNTFTEARFEIVPANWAAAIAMIAIVESFMVASSCLQVTVLLTNWPKTVKMVPYFLAAVCIAYIVSVTVIQTADLTTVCDYYPCTARSRWIFITLPILYVLFFAGIWCQRIWAHYRKMGTMSTGSRMTMVAYSSTFFGTFTALCHLAIILWWFYGATDAIGTCQATFPICLMPISEFGFDYFVRIYEALAKSTELLSKKKSGNKKSQIGQAVAGRTKKNFTTEPLGKDTSMAKQSQINSSKIGDDYKVPLPDAKAVVATSDIDMGNV